MDGDGDRDGEAVHEGEANKGTKEKQKRRQNGPRCETAEGETINQRSRSTKR